MGLSGVCFSSTHQEHFPCGIWVGKVKIYPIVRYETISFFQFEAKCMPYSFGWRTLTDSVTIEGEGISVGAGGISAHLGVVHIGTDWEEAIPSFRVPVTLQLRDQ